MTRGIYGLGGICSLQTMSLLLFPPVSPFHSSFILMFFFTFPPFTSPHSFRSVPVHCLTILFYDSIH